MTDRKPMMAGNWKMNHNHLEAIQVVQKLVVPAREEGLRRRRGRRVPGVHRAALGADDDRRRPHPDRARRAELPLRERGRVHRRGQPADAREAEREVRDRRALRAARAVRRDRRDRRQEAARGARRRHATDRVRAGRRSRSASRGDRRRSCRARSRRVPNASRRTTPSSCVVAYEPIWAIGTGRNATPDDANATIGVIRSTLRDWSAATRRRHADPLRRQHEARATRPS